MLLSYGNSTQEGSPNYGDQLELFSRKEMRDVRYYKEDVLEGALRTEVLVDGKFEAMDKRTE